MLKSLPSRKKQKIDPLILRLFPSSVRKGDLAKAQIVQAIVEIVANEGLEGLSFERIGKEVGMAKSHVVYHFQSKTEILLKAYQYVLNYAQSYIVEGVLESEPGFDRYEAYVRAHFEWMKIKPSHFPFIVILYGKCAYDSEIRKFNLEVRIAAKDRIRAFLAEDSQIAISLHEEAAIFLHEIITGVLVDLSCSYGFPPPEREKKIKLAAVLSQAGRYWKSLRG